MDIAFHRPTTLADAIALLAADSDARALAGGQTLVAMLNLGFAEPSALVALAHVAELRGISRLEDGSLRIGAMTTHAEIAVSEALVDGQRLLADTARQIADPAVRNFGTVGGSCAHGDSVADWPPALVAAGASIVVTGVLGTRNVLATEFFKGLFSTALEPSELIEAILVPKLAGRGLYRKIGRVEGDYATVSIAAVASERDGVCATAQIAIGACGPRPVRVGAAEELLVGRRVDGATAKQAGAILAAAIDPMDDVRASAAYRRRVLPQLVAGVVMEVLGP